MTVDNGENVGGIEPEPNRIEGAHATRWQLQRNPHMSMLTFARELLALKAWESLASAELIFAFSLRIVTTT